MRKKAVAAAVVITILMLTTSCGTNKKTTALDEVYSSIESLDYRGALDLIENIEEGSEDERLVKRAEGIAYLGLGSYQEAIDAFESALGMSNGIINNVDYDINYYLATAYYKNGNPDEALKIYDAILSLKNDSVDALYLEGILYAEKDDIDKAMECFDRAIVLAPENYDMLIEIYTILDENGYKEVGLDYLKDAMENGTKKMSNYEKGQISYYLGDFESARTYLEKAKDEKGSEAVLFLGKTYETLGDVNYAVSVYSSYANANADSAEVLNQMGLCKLRMEDYEGALNAFQLAMNIEDNGIMQTLKFNEIVAYEYMGDFKKACVLLESYMRLYPDDEEAQREYIFLKTR